MALYFLPLAVAAGLNPVGYDIIYIAYNSGEQLAQSRAVLICCALGVLTAMALIEFGIRKFLISRQRRRAGGVANG
jgi:hypothetical protein